MFKIYLLLVTLVLAVSTTYGEWCDCVSYPDENGECGEVPGNMYNSANPSSDGTCCAWNVPYAYDYQPNVTDSVDLQCNHYEEVGGGGYGSCTCSNYDCSSTYTVQDTPSYINNGTSYEFCMSDADQAKFNSMVQQAAQAAMFGLVAMVIFCCCICGGICYICSSAASNGNKGGFGGVPTQAPTGNVMPPGAAVPAAIQMNAVPAGAPMAAPIAYPGAAPVAAAYGAPMAYPGGAPPAAAYPVPVPGAYPGGAPPAAAYPAPVPGAYPGGAPPGAAYPPAGGGYNPGGYNPGLTM